MERISAELADAEAVLERWMMAPTELAKALAAGGEQARVPVASVREAPAVSENAPDPVAGSVVPRWREAATVDVLAVYYRRVVTLVESGAGEGGEGISAKQLAAGLQLELVPADGVAIGRLRGDSPLVLLGPVSRIMCGARS